MRQKKEAENWVKKIIYKSLTDNSLLVLDCTRWEACWQAQPTNLKGEKSLKKV
jgi:hypothetical protein